MERQADRPAAYERLIAGALSELGKAALAAEQGRLVRSYSVQLLLALLFDRSDGDPAPFEAFLRHACDDRGFLWARATRTAEIRRALHGIRQGVARGTGGGARRTATPAPRPGTGGPLCLARASMGVTALG